MDEQFRMLGRERQADLDREAQRFALADLVKRGDAAPERVRPWLFRRLASMVASSRPGFRPVKAKPDTIPAAPPR